MQRSVERAEALRAAYASGREPDAFGRLRALAGPLRSLSSRSELGFRAALALEPVTTTMGDEQVALDQFSLIRAEGPPELRVAAWCAAGRIRLRRADFAALAREWLQVERQLASCNDAEAQVTARVVAAHALAWTADVELASALLVDAKAIAAEEGRQLAATLCQAQLAHVALHAEDRRAALDLADDAIRRAKPLTMPRLFALTHWSRGWARARFGDLDEAAFSLELTARVQGRLGESAPAAAVWARLIELHGWRGDEDAVARAVRGALTEAARAPRSSATVEVHAACARLYRERRDATSTEIHRTVLVDLAATSRDGKAEVALRALDGLEGPFAGELRRRRSRTVVWLDGSRIQPPERGEVDLNRRRAVRNLLAALAERLSVAPGESLKAEELMRLGWPRGGSRKQLPSPADLHSAIWTLRKLGLDGALETTADGYRLRPEQVALRNGPR